MRGTNIERVWASASLLNEVAATDDAYQWRVSVERRYCHRPLVADEGEWECGLLSEPHGPVKPPLGLRLLSQLRVWALGSLRVQDSAGIWRLNLASVQAAVVGGG